MATVATIRDRGSAFHGTVLILTGLTAYIARFSQWHDFRVHHLIPTFPLIALLVGGRLVVDSRPSDDGAAIRRRRECQDCGFRFTTYERTEWDLQVKKRDGTVEPYSREKLRAGIERAVEKRPVTDEQVTDIVDAIETALRERDSRIVSSTDVGDLVSTRLHDLDKVAYLRFVSVYKAFEDPEEFRRELDEVLDGAA